MPRRNLITDVPGVRVGNAHDDRLASRVTALHSFDKSTIASGDVRGGGARSRETDLLDPTTTVEQVDADCVFRRLGVRPRFPVGRAGVVAGSWPRLSSRRSACRSCLARCCSIYSTARMKMATKKPGHGFRPIGSWLMPLRTAPPRIFKLGTSGAGYGATVVNLKGGLGSASATTPDGITVGAIVAVNAVGCVTVGDTKHFWAAPFEQNNEFGGHGSPAKPSADELSMRLKGASRVNTTLAIVVTDAILDARSGETARCHGTGRLCPRDLPRPYTARRRYGLRRCDRREGAGRSLHRPCTTRRSRGQRAGACDRARRIRSNRPAVQRRFASVSRQVSLSSLVTKTAPPDKARDR